MSLRIKLVAEAREVVRPVCISVVAMAVVASAMAAKGWHVHSAVLGGVIAVVALAMIYQVHRSVSHLHQRSVDVREMASRCEHHYLDVLRRIIAAVEGRDKYTQGRSERIGMLCERISRELGLPEEQCRLMYLAGQLHDIGLLAVPEKILNKPASLTATDSKVVEQHSEVSCEVLQPLTMLTKALPAIRHHHERMNGTGYPAGLSGEAIPLEARILAVADAYDAMTHDRPHRPALTSLQAMHELCRCSPDGFDFACVQALAHVVNMPGLEVAMASA